MAGANSNSGKQTKYYSLKAKVDAQNTPFFALSEKNADGKWVTTEKFDTMIGFLVSAEIKAKEFEGAKFNTFVFKMEDDNETSLIEFTHNSVTHSLINTLASDCNKINNYSIQVYRKQSKDKQYWNGGVSIKANGSEEGMKWHIDPQSAPKKEAVTKADGQPFTVQGKQVWDDSKLRVFWEEIFVSKIQNALNSAAAKPAQTTPTNTATTNSTPPVFQGSNDNEDLPF